MLTQNAALHTDMVQQLGPWPLPHCLSQGHREQILTGNFSSNAQGLSQPEGRRGGSGPKAQGQPLSIPRGHLPAGEPDNRTLIVGTNHLYHVTQAAPDEWVRRKDELSSPPKGRVPIGGDRGQ